MYVLFLLFFSEPNSQFYSLIYMLSPFTCYFYILHVMFMPPFEKGGTYCVAPVGRYVGMSVGMSVALNLVQLITQEGFALEASNLVGR